MRLFNVHTKRLENFYRDPTEPYAILSHTWGKEEDELSFQDLEVLDQCDGERKAKLAGTCAQAIQDGISYVWIDTCCIDKRSAVELSEAINSMFRWYQQSAICYAYLSDVEPGQSDICKSKWFTRGWTLQELLAARKVSFFDASWNPLGTKSSLSAAIGETTGVPHHILAGIGSLETCSVAQRMSWASRRTTTRPEDMAYCLLGIFNVTISPIYGEGLERAFGRLQEAIMKQTLDDSILAWLPGLPVDPENFQSLLPLTSGGVLATSPAAFAGCGDIVQRSPEHGGAHSTKSPELTGGALRIEILLAKSSTELRYGLLSCGPRNRPSFCAAIPLVPSPDRKVTDSSADRVFIRPHHLHTVCGPRLAEPSPLTTIVIRNDRIAELDSSDKKSYWFYLPPEPWYPWNAAIEEVYPPESFESEMAMIRTPKEDDLKQESRLFLVRFRYPLPSSDKESDASGSGQLILALEFFPESATGKKEPQAYLYFDSEPSTQLSTIFGFWPTLSCTGATEIIDTRQPSPIIRISVNKQIIDRHSLWVVSLSNDPSPVLTITPSMRPGFPHIKQVLENCERGENVVRLNWEACEISKLLKDGRSALSEGISGVEATAQKIEDVDKEMDRLLGVRRLLEVEWATQRMHLDRIARENTQNESRMEDVMKEVTRVYQPAFGPSLWPMSAMSETSAKNAKASQSGELDAVLRHIMHTRPLKINGEKVAWVPGMTLLMYAAATGNPQFVKRILDYDSDIRAKDSQGRSASEWASLSGLSGFQDLVIEQQPPSANQSSPERHNTPIQLPNSSTNLSASRVVRFSDSSSVRTRSPHAHKPPEPEASREVSLVSCLPTGGPKRELLESSSSNGHSSHKNETEPRGRRKHVRIELDREQSQREMNKAIHSRRVFNMVDARIPGVSVRRRSSSRESIRQLFLREPRKIFSDLVRDLLR